MKKRVHALLLAVLLFITGIVADFTPVANAVAAEGSTLVIHWQKADKDYSGWDAWVWSADPNAEGEAVKFTAEDSYGKIAVFKSKDAIKEAGFIIRKDDWSEKDCSDDQIVPLKDGFAEIWVVAGTAGYETKAPDGATPVDLNNLPAASDNKQTTTAPATGEITVNIHYHRNDSNYDGWNVWLWPEGGEGAAYEFTDENDEYKLCTANFDASAGKVGFIIRLNEWEAKDVDEDRFVDLTKAKGNVLDVYVIEAEKEFKYDPSQVDLSPKIQAAVLTSATQIKVSTNAAITEADKITNTLFKVFDESGKEYTVSKVAADATNKNNYFVTLADTLDFTNNYTIKSDYYGEKLVSKTGIYDSDEFDQQFYYDGDDLGATYTKKNTTFKVWSPLATEVVLKLYKDGLEGNAYKEVPMTLGEKGVWETKVDGDLNGVFYTYAITNDGTTKEAVDLYARTTGANGKRGMVVDLEATDPEGFADDVRPELVAATDACIYELHIRDFTIDPSSGVSQKNRGKYLGLTEKGTKNSNGDPTALDHILDLGVTHVQIMPSYDFSPNSVDETKNPQTQFNWGYDPYNYNVPEGSYASDPYDGAVRVNEYKQMVKSFHDNDVRVIMDVVYNHTAESANSYFNMTVPDYYYRLNDDGSFSNGSGCGNEVASERAMVRKYIVDSVVYWATEYHIDGFRFDLMGLIDMETMEAIREALDEIDPSIIILGEGWTGGASKLGSGSAALKKNILKMDGQIAAFSDDIRDGLKGSVFGKTDTGFATGKALTEERIKSGVIAATKYPGISWAQTGTDLKSAWSDAPTDTINYVSAHDNMTLWDKISASNSGDSEETRIKMNLLCAGVVYTAQGIPFMLSGEEILRSKGGDENSYKSPDKVNSIKWDEMNMETYEFYKGIIALRKSIPAFRMTTAEDVAKYLTFLEDVPDNMVAYKISKGANGYDKDVVVVYNANPEDTEITIPDGKYDVYVKGSKAGTDVIETISGGKIKVEGISTLVLVGDIGAKTTAAQAETDSNNTLLIVIIIVVAVLVVAGVVTAIVVSKKKKKKAAQAAAGQQAVAGEGAVAGETQTDAGTVDAGVGAADAEVQGAGEVQAGTVDAGAQAEQQADTTVQETPVQGENGAEQQ